MGKVPLSCLHLIVRIISAPYSRAHSDRKKKVCLLIVHRPPISINVLHNILIQTHWKDYLHSSNHPNFGNLKRKVSALPSMMWLGSCSIPFRPPDSLLLAITNPISEGNALA
uniref:Uncharacterized protein n=1 Tax=Schistocephalus solidus TaxID=70667 RepID=A0A0X3PYI1_SCHSO